MYSMGLNLTFPKPFEHKHKIRNVQEMFEEQLSVGQRMADGIATMMGSWTFIIVQSIILVFWMILNVTAFIMHWDPYPFILMNLVLSMQAAYTAPMIMMSQNRQAMRDRLEAHSDYLINVKAEDEVRHIMDHLDAESTALIEIHRSLVAIHQHLGIPFPKQPNVPGAEA
jgi:uncharacterized membrane protein